MDGDADGNADVLVVGETLVDFIAEGNATLADADTFSRRAGGAPANVAAGLAALDVPAWLCTRVGEDAFGDYLARELDACGVPDRFVQRDAERATGLAFAASDGFAFHSGADAHVDTTLVPDDALDAASWLVVGGILLSEKRGRRAVRNLVGRARDRGCRVCFDPNRRPECWRGEEYGSVVADIVTIADVVCASPGDLVGTQFDADQPERAAQQLLAAGPDLAVLTRGGAGALAAASADSWWGERTVSHAGFDVDAVDATGAGDAFLAGLLAALRDAEAAGEPDLAGALAYANACGALATTAVGAMGALPDRAAVADLVGEGVEE
jgi:fructokinase